jgi:hypothetical protein
MNQIDLGGKIGAVFDIPGGTENKRHEPQSARALV